jgi:hypothetical protein
MFTIRIDDDAIVDLTPSLFFPVALEKETAEPRAKQFYFETVAARLDALELKLNQPVQVTAETTTSDETARLNR